MNASNQPDSMIDGREVSEASAIYVIIVIIVFLILLGAVIIEAGVIYMAYTHADKVDCNWLWCTFATVRSEGTSNIVSNMISTQDCYQNGVRINCSEIQAWN